MSACVKFSRRDNWDPISSTFGIFLLFSPYTLSIHSSTWNFSFKSKWLEIQCDLMWFPLLGPCFYSMDNNRAKALCINKMVCKSGLFIHHLHTLAMSSKLVKSFSLARYLLHFVGIFEVVKTWNSNKQRQWRDEKEWMEKKHKHTRSVHIMLDAIVYFISFFIHISYPQHISFAPRLLFRARTQCNAIRSHSK